MLPESRFCTGEKTATFFLSLLSVQFGFSFTYTSMSVFQDNDWDTSVQFLPASDNKKLEKKKGLGKIGAVIGVVVFAAVVALMTGLLVWHFHCKNNLFVGFRDQ